MIWWTNADVRIMDINEEWIDCFFFDTNHGTNQSQTAEMQLKMRSDELAEWQNDASVSKSNFLSEVIMVLQSYHDALHNYCSHIYCTL